MEVDDAQVDRSQIETLATRIAGMPPTSTRCENVGLHSWLATFPEGSKVSSAMQSLSDILLDDEDIRELFETCIDPNNDYVDIRKSQASLFFVTKKTMRANV